MWVPSLSLFDVSDLGLPPELPVRPAGVIRPVTIAIPTTLHTVSQSRATSAAPPSKPTNFGTPAQTKGKGVRGLLLLRR